MSTTNTTTFGFNNAGMGAYNSMMPNLASMANSYMSNPFGNPFFQTQQQLGYKTAAQQNQTNMSNITRNLNLSGLSTSSPFALEMMNNQMRAGTGNSANLGFLSPVSNAQQMQMNMASIAGSFKPLQTSSSQTQSGLGTWLPQLLGAGLGLAGGLLKGGGGGAAQSPQQVSNVWGSGAMTGGMPSPFAPTAYDSSPYMGMGAPSAGGYNFGPSPFTMGQP